MKVTGTGDPAFLTLRLREREVEGLRKELQARATALADAVSTNGIIDADCAPVAAGAAIMPLIERLETATPNSHKRVLVEGPTWVLGPAIETAALAAAEHLAEATRWFDVGECTAEALSNAAASASAWSETLMGYSHVKNYGLTE